MGLDPYGDNCASWRCAGAAVRSGRCAPQGHLRLLEDTSMLDKGRVMDQQIPRRPTAPYPIPVRINMYFLWSVPLHMQRGNKFGGEAAPKRKTQTRFEIGDQTLKG